MGIQSDCVKLGEKVGTPFKGHFKALLPDVLENYVVSCTYHLPMFKPHISCLLSGVRTPRLKLVDEDLQHMKYAPRFGKPKQKRQQKDSHNNYNRGWGWGGQGFEEGAYKAKKSNHRFVCLFVYLFFFFVCWINIFLL